MKQKAVIHQKCVYLAIVMASLLAGCGTSEEGSESVNLTDDSTVIVLGSVGDGPIINSNVSAYDNSGFGIASAKGDSTANYSIKLFSTDEFPVKLESTGGVDVVTSNAPDFTLSAVVPDANVKIANLNPFSTLIVKIAQSIPGGLTRENIGLANGYVQENLNFGLDPVVVPNAMTTETNTGNVAMIVKASETLGETIRRTTDMLAARGKNLTEDDVIDSLAADLVDGLLDGKSGVYLVPEVSAAFTLMSAETLLESIKNDLQVGGTNANTRMNDAIKLTMPNAPGSAKVDNLPLTDEELNQTKLALAALEAASGNTDITLVLSTLDSLKTSTARGAVGGQLHASTDSIVATALSTVSAMDDASFTTARGSIYSAIANGYTPISVGSEGEVPVTGLSRINYVWGVLNTGSTVYVDRAYTYTSVPTQYQGLKYLQTANNDKGLTDTNLITFDIGSSAIVFVAHDSRIASIPSWLADWTATGNVLTTSDGGNQFQVYSKQFAAGTVALGANTGGAAYSMYTVFVQAGASGAAPIAKADTASTSDSAAVIINVLSNDLNLTDTPVTLSIVQNPANGTLQINADNTITYTPGGVIGTDSFIYKVADADGDYSTTTVTVNVSCGSCADGVMLNLNWNANPTDENVLAYKVYMGSDAGSTTTLAKTIGIGDAGFNSSAPAYSFDAGVDLQLHFSDSICFKISAVNIAGESPASDVVCQTI
ncbi:MAG: Ig-like domain-containing protein [Gammaproteobacteria bacterium]|nr:Ig-like domain-containing protein [Gammaproteobacteria bacterium]